MRNFHRLATNCQTGNLLAQIMTQPELWNQYKVRTTSSGPLAVHHSVDDIILRYNKYASGEDFMDKICSSLEVVDYPAWGKLPGAQSLIHALISLTQGIHLGRCMISRIPPGGGIPLHSDRIGPAEEMFPDRIPPAVYYDRYHFVLNSAPGTVFSCGDEECYMAPGELWWFNNEIPHSVVNNSAEDRIHLVCDLRVKHDDYIPQIPEHQIVADDWSVSQVVAELEPAE